MAGRTVKGRSGAPETVTRVVKYQIDVSALTADQKALLERHAGCARGAWNWATARWKAWMDDVAHHLRREIRAVAFANLPDDLTTEQLGEALVLAAQLQRSPEHKAWRDEVRARGREIHGDYADFQDAYRLASIYRTEAISDAAAGDEDSRLAWWHAEGAGRSKGTAAHGVSTFAYQTALADFAQAVKVYWTNPRYSKKTGRRLGAPQFKSKRDQRDSFALMNLTRSDRSTWNVVDDGARGHRLAFPNLGSVRMIENTKTLRRMTARGGFAKSARFTRRGERWYVAINVAIPADHPSIVEPARTSRRQRAGGAVGIDLGVKALATLSDGTQIAGRREDLILVEHAVQLLQKKYDRQHREGSPECFEHNGVHVKGGCRWGGSKTDSVPLSRAAQTTKRQMARLRDLQSRRRTGVLHELTARLVRDHDLIAIEDLNVAGMTSRAKKIPDPERPGAFLPNRRRAKGGLNRAILHASFGEFQRQLEYKAQRSGARLVRVDRFAPTSKTCSHCGTARRTLSLAERTYRCDVCGLVIDRDVNAAINIRRLGIEQARSADLAFASPPEAAAPMASSAQPGVGVVGNAQALGATASAEQSPAGSDSTGRATDPSPPTQALTKAA